MNKDKKIINKELFLPIVNNMKSKNYDKAINLLNQLLDQNQDEDIINKLKASVYLKKKDWKKSLSCYEKIKNKENSFEIVNNIGVALYNLGRLLEASIKFEKSLHLNNSYLPAYENLISTYVLLGKYDLSVKFIIQSLKLDPNNRKITSSLIDIFNYHEPKEIGNSIINANHRINKLNLLIKSNNIIKDSTLQKILRESE